MFGSNVDSQLEKSFMSLCPEGCPFFFFNFNAVLKKKSAISPRKDNSSS